MIRFCRTCKVLEKEKFFEMAMEKFLKFFNRVCMNSVLTYLVICVLAYLVVYLLAYFLVYFSSVSIIVHIFTPHFV